MTAILSKLLILAGGGTAPRRVIESCRAKNRPFFVVCLQGQADADIAHNVPHIWLPLGAGGALRDVVQSEQIKELVMIGHVRRPSLSEIKPDWLAVKFLAKVGINALGDDALLRALGSAMESELGVRVIGAHEILGGILTKTGLLGRHKPDATAEQDIARGIAIARLLGQADVGQSVIVQQGLVLGVEAIEGTDALIARCAPLRRMGVGGVLVKIAKPQQDDRFDLPTIGPDTLRSASDASLRGVAIEAGRSLLIDRDQVRQIADEAGIFVTGIEI